MLWCIGDFGADWRYQPRYECIVKPNYGLGDNSGLVLIAVLDLIAVVFLLGV